MRKLTILLGCLSCLALVGCDDDTTNPDVVEPDDLSPPLGLFSITGDESVTLFWWCSNYDDDLVGYRIYMATGDHHGDPLEEVPTAFTSADSIDIAGPNSGQLSVMLTGLSNGTTYSFLVVAAKDSWTDISHTSNIVADTPREETATEATLYAKQVDEILAGFELNGFFTVDCTDFNRVTYETITGEGDIMCERFDIAAGTRFWLDGINGATIQDIGYMSDWDGADLAPGNGYAATGHSVEAIMGHVYAIKTADDHYAKVQVVGLDDVQGTVTIKAAYQSQAGNPEYK